jgi:hypothetical protein
MGICLYSKSNKIIQAEKNATSFIPDRKGDKCGRAPSPQNGPLSGTRALLGNHGEFGYRDL